MTEKTGKNTVGLRPWRKGQSGNPGGRPKMDRTIVELAREHTAAAMQTLIDIAADKDAPPSARVGAAQAILDRGWGKATQVIEATVKEQLTIEQIDMRLAALITA